MHSKNMIPLFFIVASLTSTSLGLHHLEVTARRSLDIIRLGVLARQTNSCDSICETVDSTLTNCADNTDSESAITSCSCTSAIAASLQDCLDCSVEADPSADAITFAENLANIFDSTCLNIVGVPSVTINTNAGTGTFQSTPSTATLPRAGSPSTTIVPSSATSATLGLPLKSSASPNKIILHWTVAALLVLAAGNLLVF